MRDLGELISAFELAVSRAQGVVSQADMEEIEAVLRRVVARRGHPGDTFVIALVGGTGSGKSSLLNAMVGDEVASVSAVRPHTEVPLAVVPEPSDPQLDEVLDRLGIKAVPGGRAGMAIVDLPDQDSIEMGHRRVVWEVLPMADAIAFVVDPHKYRSRLLHEDYVRALRDYHDQSIFVMNKLDQVPEPERDDLLESFGDAVREQGVEDPVVLGIAANPPDGDPVDVDAVWAVIDEWRAADVLTAKVIADIMWASRRLAISAGVERGGAVGFDDRWEGARDEVVAAIAAGGSPSTVAGVLERFVTWLVGEVGGSFGGRIAAAIPADALDEVVESAIAASPRKRRRKRAPGPEVVALLEERVGSPLRELVRERSLLGASLASLAVEAAQAQGDARSR